MYNMSLSSDWCDVFFFKVGLLCLVSAALLCCTLLSSFRCNINAMLLAALQFTREYSKLAILHAFCFRCQKYEKKKNNNN